MKNFVSAVALAAALISTPVMAQETAPTVADAEAMRRLEKDDAATAAGIAVYRRS